MTTELQLSHFTKTGLGAIRSVEQRWDDDYRSSFAKPRGLWVSVDGEDDWQQWCQSEMPEWMNGVQRYRVHLAQPNNVLLLTDLWGFQDEYGRIVPDRFGSKYIDWPTVAKAYDGIIIAPYQWSCRMEMDWYYGWDCASGCIWNADAIARVEEWREAA